MFDFQNMKKLLQSSIKDIRSFVKEYNSFWMGPIYFKCKKKHWEKKITRPYIIFGSITYSKFKQNNMSILNDVVLKFFPIRSKIYSYFMGNTQKFTPKAQHLLEKYNIQEYKFVRLYNKVSCRSQELIQAVDTDVGFFHEGSWKKENIEKICPFIDEWDVSSLFLSGNYEPTIIIQISHIAFLNVSCLWLCDNQIHSLEELVRVELPSLVSIRCDSNKITKTKVLEKAIWPKLRTFDLSKNYLTDNSSLSLMNLRNLASLDLRHSKKWKTGDKRWLLKLNSREFRSLNYTTEIPKHQTDQKILEKWDHLHIYR